MEGLNKLLLNTNAHCVLCLSSANTSKLCKTDSDSPFQYTVQISNVPKVCSFNSICKYLNIRLNDKVECDDEGNEPDPELIGTFCNECAHLLERFSAEFRELKRIRISLQFRLNLICDKIKEADQKGGINAVKIKKSVNGKLGKTAQAEENDIDVVILELLRRKTLESCNNKFGKDVPRVRVQNLTMKQVAKQRLKLRIESGEKVTNDNIDGGQGSSSGKLRGKYIGSPTSENLAVPILESLLVKVEDSNENPEQYYLDEFIQPFAKGDDDDNNGTDMSPPPGAGTVEWNLNQLKEEAAPNDFKTESRKMNRNAKTSSSRSRNRANNKSGKSTIAKKLKVRTTHPGTFLRLGLGHKRTTPDQISPPKPRNSKPYIIIRSSQPPSKNVPCNPSRCFDSKTKQYKCNICSKGYILRKSFYDHYSRNHLHPVKYRCVSCGQEFSRADACQRHHRVIHAPVVEEKFKCLRCNKVFQRKDYLTKHQESDCRNCPGFKFHQIEINE